MIFTLKLAPDKKSFMIYYGEDEQFVDGTNKDVLFFEIYDGKLSINDGTENFTTNLKPIDNGNGKLAQSFKLTGKNISNFLKFQFALETIGFAPSLDPKNVKSESAGFINSYQFYLIIGGVILIVAAAVGGGLAWYYCRKKKAIKNQAVTPIQIKVEPRTETKTETKTTKEEEKKPKKKKKDDKQESSRSSARKYFSRKNIKYANASELKAKDEAAGGKNAEVKTGVAVEAGNQLQVQPTQATLDATQALKTGGTDPTQEKTISKNESLKPRKMPMIYDNVKSIEEIRKGKVVGKNELPTFDDIESDWDGDLVVNKPKQGKDEPGAAAQKISKVEVENVKTDLTSAKIVVPAESSKGASASAAGTSNAGRKDSQELPLVTAVDEPETKKEEVVKTTQTDNK
uniref:Uncharacterized protein n=1 Tax=Panagrolaimus sp. JU765 TaxID=591449 RepID=A0AC34QDZ4_9BILA